MSRLRRSRSKNDGGTSNLALSIAPAFETLRDRAAAIYIVIDALLVSNRASINALALDARLPTMHGNRERVDAGGPISYGPHFPELWRRSAEFIDKILRGAKPADIPVVQPTKFDLAVSLKSTLVARWIYLHGRFDLPRTVLCAPQTEFPPWPAYRFVSETGYQQIKNGSSGNRVGDSGGS
jgi:hypothetical protein